jgi:hypothetical protein
VECGVTPCVQRDRERVAGQALEHHPDRQRQGGTDAEYCKRPDAERVTPQLTPALDDDHRVGCHGDEGTVEGGVAAAEAVEQPPRAEVHPAGERDVDHESRDEPHEDGELADDALNDDQRRQERQQKVRDRQHRVVNLSGRERWGE